MHLCLDLCDTRSDSFFVAGTIDNSGVLLADIDSLSSTEHVECGLLQFDTFLLGDYSTACEDGNVLQHLFATIAKARCFDSTDLKLCTQTIDYKGSQSLAVHVLSDDEQRTSALYSGFEYRQQLLEIRDLLIVDEDVWFLHLNLHSLGVGNEIGADISAVELHALYNIDGGVHTFGFADSDDAIFGNLAHCVGDEAADLSIVVGTDSSHLLNFIKIVSDDNRLLLDLLHNGSYSFVDTALEIHRISSGGHVLEPHANDGLGENGSSCCSITGLISGLRSHFFNQLCTQVLLCVSQFDFFGYGDTIFGDVRSTVFLIDNYITSLRSEGYFDCIGQLVNTLFEGFARLYVIGYILTHSKFKIKNYLTIANTSD